LHHELEQEIRPAEFNDAYDFLTAIHEGYRPPTVIKKRGGRLLEKYATNELRVERLRQGLTINEVAVLLDCSPAVLQQIETDQHPHRIEIMVELLKQSECVDE
jgi:hypothetical protein